MPTQTTITDGQAAEGSLALYDMLMAEIEPELCSMELPLLEERYAGETPEEHEERMNRYELAYAVFDEAVKVLDDDVVTTVEIMKGAALEKDKFESAASDNVAMKKLESDFDSGAPVA